MAEAVNAPRVHFEDGAVQAEPGVDEEALERLERRGYEVVRWQERNVFFGGVHAVSRDPATGELCTARATRGAAARSRSPEPGALEVADDDLAVHLRPLGDLARAGDGVDERAERAGEHAHPLGLAAQLEQPLLGVGRELDPGGDPVGVQRLELGCSGGSPPTRSTSSAKAARAFAAGRGALVRVVVAEARPARPRRPGTRSPRSGRARETAARR